MKCNSTWVVTLLEIKIFLLYVFPYYLIQSSNGYLVFFNRKQQQQNLPHFVANKSKRNKKKGRIASIVWQKMEGKGAHSWKRMQSQVICLLFVLKMKEV